MVIESPIAPLAGMSRKGMESEFEVLIDDETLSSILADSSEEVASLSAALKA